ncbi:multidrug transporter [Entomomonas asaccharolytica]|uniref:Multidrug transporter n=1 Tax=Entomomonas asaccharolytica TaxID=2785331 RepID=A0A974NHL4_9GAMM|nr:multidrug transporter [Entomomonas asaccharolytica]QQP87000.1 multidrug transporter [Entomomonas asaccharolytica]
MNTLRRIATTFVLALGIIAVPAHAATDYTEQGQYEDPRFDVNAPPAYAMIGDLVIARPLGAVMTVIGTGVFLVTLPFSALGGNVGEAADALVAEPARLTFARCLGCTSTHKPYRADNQ